MVDRDDHDDDGISLLAGNARIVSNALSASIEPQAPAVNITAFNREEP